MSTNEEQKTNVKKSDRTQKTVEVALQFGSTLLTGILLGVGSAAGGHAYNRAIASRASEGR